MADDGPTMDAKQWALGAFAVLLLAGTFVKVCTGGPAPAVVPVVVAPEPSGAPPVVAPPLPKAKTGLSAPIAAAWMPGGDVIVAGLDVPSKSIKVQRIDRLDAVVASANTFDGMDWSHDSDLKVAASSDGVAVTWRGLRDKKLVRQLALLGTDLKKRGEPFEVAAASCSTRDAFWFADGTTATALRWNGDRSTFPLPKEKEASLLCSPTRAFAVIEEDERSSILPLQADAGAPVTMMGEKDFGEDDQQRELSEYTVVDQGHDEVGVVRLAQSGALALRETKRGAAGVLHKLKTLIGENDDVVAVDASPRMVLVVYTQETSDACPDGSGSKILALRVDRQSFEESVVELSPARCGGENGPYFTGALGDQISVTWVERTSGVGKARAPIVGLSHITVGIGGTPVAARVEQASDAIVDAGCDGTKCFAVALIRGEDNDVMKPGYARVMRW